MTSRLNLLHQQCGELGVAVEWVDLGPHYRGRYSLPAATITLSYRLTEVQATCTLAHELGHVLRGDAVSTTAAERRAWRYAASRLITPASYAAAEVAVGSHVGALALALEVTPRLVATWRTGWVNWAQVSA